jgi:aliphatic nitrilase
MKRHLKLAAVQAAPVFLDRTATIDKAIVLMERAAESGAELIGFPETWIPGYPWWIWLGPPHWGLQFAARYRRNAMRRDGPEMQALCDAARRFGLVCVFGHAELFGGSLYMGQTIVDSDGSVKLHRRKLKPSRAERMVFGEGDGSGLTIVETSVGRVGALNCWEHLQPLSKFALAAQNEEIHVASWPALSMARGRAYAPGPEMSAAISQVYGLENACFVVAPTAMMDEATLAIVADTDERRAMVSVPGLPASGGFAMVYGPDGRPLAAVIPESEEGLVVAEIDREALVAAKLGADPAGHSGRPDVTRLLIDRRPMESVVEFASPGDCDATLAFTPERPAG